MIFPGVRGKAEQSPCSLTCLGSTMGRNSPESMTAGTTRSITASLVCALLTNSQAPCSLYPGHLPTSQRPFSWCLKTQAEEAIWKKWEAEDPLFADCVTLAKSLPLSVPLFPCKRNEGSQPFVSDVADTGPASRGAHDQRAVSGASPVPCLPEGPP